MTKKPSPFDIAKNINSAGERLDVNETGYEPWVTNIIYSNTPDSVFFANMMNRYWSLPKQMQYDFYRFGLDRNPRRYGKWEKRAKTEDDILQICEALNYSRAKALEVYPILKDRMDEIRSWNDKGGKK